MFWLFYSFFFLINLSIVQVTDSLEDFDGACFNLEDGLHHLGPCEGKVLHCVGGKSTLRLCPSPLLFNPGTKFCEKLEELLKLLHCTSEHEPLSSNSFAHVPIWSNSPDDSWSGETQSFVDDSVPVWSNSPDDSWSDETQSFVDDSVPMWSNSPSSSGGCVAMEVPSGCRPFYIACAEGRQVQRFCPSGLFFNVEKESCEEWRMIAHCVQIRVAIPPKSVTPPSAVTRHTIVSPQRKAPIAFPPNRFCSELANGFYRHPTNCSRIIQVWSTSPTSGAPVAFTRR
ncbi:hypothetical protein niasHS_002482 [Heterodera schachtii]|uniref:Chitin-binding type-2 domain-containing protein n=1 Tax=Heterodera schachtii TaxID=97005 RepID=A0ABD2KK44_HETSC